MRFCLVLSVMFFCGFSSANSKLDALILAIKADDEAKVLELLTQYELESSPYQDLNLGNSDWPRPIFWARSPRMVELLVAHGAQRPQPIFCELMEAIAADNVDLVQEILDASQDTDPNTIAPRMHRAVINATSPQMLMALIHRGALLTVSKKNRLPYRDKKGNNALHILAENARVLLARFPSEGEMILARVERTAHAFIRMDAALNGSGNLILAMRNQRGERAFDVFRGLTFNQEFLARLQQWNRALLFSSHGESVLRKLNVLDVEPVAIPLARRAPVHLVPFAFDDSLADPVALIARPQVLDPLLRIPAVTNLLQSPREEEEPIARSETPNNLESEDDDENLFFAMERSFEGF